MEDPGNKVGGKRKQSTITFRQIETGLKKTVKGRKGGIKVEKKSANSVLMEDMRTPEDWSLASVHTWHVNSLQQQNLNKGMVWLF